MSKTKPLVTELEPPKITPLNWVAEVARLLPDATFKEDRAKRDRKRRLQVIVGKHTVHCIVGETSPADVVEALRT